jgi:lipooligosaccharide transport system permease protein
MMDRVNDVIPYALAVWFRHFLVWQETLWSSAALQIVNPLLFLFAFGFGMGAVIDQMGGLSYLAFIVPGMMAYSAMFTISFESSISAYSRFTMQKTWGAMLATPLTLDEVLVGEAFWSVTKGMMSTAGVLLIGYLWGGIGSLPGALLSIPVILLGGFTFAACGLAATAHAKSWEFVSYFMTFWVTPNFMFSGVFFSVDRFPDYIEWLSWILPTAHLIAVIRPLVAAQPLEPLAVLVHLGYLAVLGSVMFFLARRRLQARLFD